MAAAEVVQKIEYVTLRLSLAEVRTLIALTSLCGGDPRNSPRKHSDAIGRAVRDATGWSYSDVNEYQLMKHNAVMMDMYPVDHAERED